MTILKMNGNYILNDIYKEFIKVLTLLSNYEMKSSINYTSSGNKSMYSYKLDIPMRRDKVSAGVYDTTRVRITDVTSPTPKNPNRHLITVEIRYINTVAFDDEVIAGTNRIGRYFQKFDTAFEKLRSYLEANTDAFDIVRFYEENPSVALYREAV